MTHNSVRANKTLCNKLHIFRHWESVKVKYSNFINNNCLNAFNSIITPTTHEVFFHKSLVAHLPQDRFEDLQKKNCSKLYSKECALPFISRCNVSQPLFFRQHFFNKHKHRPHNEVVMENKLTSWIHFKCKTNMTIFLRIMQRGKTAINFP